MLVRLGRSTERTTAHFTGPNQHAYDQLRAVEFNFARADTWFVDSIEVDRPLG
jgi:hypothetical protein